MADYSREQARFADFCAADGRDARRAGPDDVLAWLEAEQPSGRTAAHWIAAIRAAPRDPGQPDPCAGAPATWVRRARNPGTRRGRETAEVSVLAARIPVVGWPAGLRGRRNRLAFILHHLADIPARDLVTLRTGGLAVTGHGTVTVIRRGAPITVTAPGGYPAACPACAAARWGWVLRHAADLNAPAIERALRREPLDPDAHVCGPMDAVGPTSWPLFPACTKQGRFALPPIPPMSVRSMEELLRAALAGRGTYREIPKVSRLS